MKENFERRKYSRELFALDQHIRFSEREWVDVFLRIDIRKTVVHESMRRLVAPNGIDDIQ